MEIDLTPDEIERCVEHPKFSGLADFHPLYKDGYCSGCRDVWFMATRNRLIKKGTKEALKEVEIINGIRKQWEADGY